MDASSSVELTTDPVVDDTAIPSAPQEIKIKRRLEFDWQAIMQSPAFIPGVILALALTAMFWGLFRDLPGIWFADEGYYSHGILVPLISAYVIFRWWPNLSKIPVKPLYIALIPLIGVLWLARASVAFAAHPVSSALLIVSILCGVAFIAGWRWMLGVTLPTLYLAFALPMWNMAITYYTNPLQTTSTTVAYKMLQLAGYQMGRTENVINLYGGHDGLFPLDVGVPCSGLKLVLALYAFTVFFVLIARLRWWANLILLFVVPLPLALFINGLRIALIGVVGFNWGADAGHWFHDNGGWSVLIVCFFILFKIARLLGWKD